MNVRPAVGPERSQILRDYREASAQLDKISRTLDAYDNHPLYDQDKAVGGVQVEEVKWPNATKFRGTKMVSEEGVSISARLHAERDSGWVTQGTWERKETSDRVVCEYHWTGSDSQSSEWFTFEEDKVRGTLSLILWPSTTVTVPLSDGTRPIS